MNSVLYQAVRDVAEWRSSECAIQDMDGTSVSYTELINLTDRLAAGLRYHGVGDGGMVACALSNSARYVALILAVARIGARYVPLMQSFGAEETALALNNSEPVLLVTDREHLVPADAVASVPLDDLLDFSPLTSEVGEFHTGIFRLLWTSGSTGLPKMMAWRQDKYVTERRRWLDDTEMLSTDIYFCRHTLDVAHATDLHVFAALLSGARLVLADPGAAPEELLDRLQAQRATVMSSLPRHYEQLVQVAHNRSKVDLSSLRRPLCGGAYLSPTLVQDSADVLGIHIQQIYGSTEFGLAMGNMADEVQTHLSMFPVHDVGSRLSPLTAQTPDIGELILRSDCTSEGYLHNDAANARTFRNGEFWTGDIAQRLPDGSYRILGRVSEALATPVGPILAPMLDAEISNACPGAESVSLAADPGGHTNRVLVAVWPGHDVPAAEVTKKIDNILAGHGLDGSIYVVDSIPHTPVGKADKPQLRAKFGW